MLQKGKARLQASFPVRRQVLRCFFHEAAHICFSYDVVLTGGASDILEKFHKLNARVVFSAEGFCWPDKNLAVSYFIYRIDLEFLDQRDWANNVP